MCTPIRNPDRIQVGLLEAKAHAGASLALANAATKLSPSPCSSGRTPSCRLTQIGHHHVEVSERRFFRSGWCSHNRVEPLDVGQQQRHRACR